MSCFGIDTYNNSKMKLPGRYSTGVCIFFYLSFIIYHSSFSQTLDATHIAENYYKGIVKIILYDSISEKKHPNSGLIGRGTGFFVTEDGIIFTNRHVVEYCIYGYIDYIYQDPVSYGKQRMLSAYSDETLYAPTTYEVLRTGYAAPVIQVYTGRGETDYKLYYAAVIAMDIGAFDGAILKIVSDINGNAVTEKFHPIPIGNSDLTKQGEDLCIYGFPAQFDAGIEFVLKDLSTLTFGKHSGWDYVFNKDYGYIKTDASINSGNSGGPVFNASNKVIGIATATSSKTNIGLVGGINGIYALARVDTVLLKKLSEAGLKPSLQKTETGSVVVFGARRKIVSQKGLKKIQSGKIAERKFQNGLFYIIAMYSPSPRNDFQVDRTVLPSIANPGVVSTSSAESGIKLGYAFPLWRMVSHFKMNIDYTFLGATVYNIVFDQIKLSDTINVVSSNFPKGTNAYFFNGLGPSFSGLLFKAIEVNAYYQATPAFCYLSGKEWLLYENTNGQKSELKPENTLFFSHVMGVSLRYRKISIGMEYNTGINKSIQTNYLVNNKSSVAGFAQLNRQAFFLKIGMAFPEKD